jgi:hypothetical protein
MSGASSSLGYRVSGVKLAKTNTADARFLRRVLMGLVILTLATGSIAAYMTVSAMADQGVDICQATGFLCSN